MDSGLSEYERIRLENIKRNESFLTGIGLPSSQQPRRKPASSAGKRKVVERVHIEGERKSSRIRNAPTDHKQLRYAESDDDDALFGAEENGRRASMSTKSKRVSTREVIKYETKPVNTSSSKSSREVDANYSIFIGFDADMDHMRYNEDVGDLSGGAAPSRAPGGDFKEVNGKWVKIEGSGGSGKKNAGSASKKDSRTSSGAEKVAAPSSTSSSSSSSSKTNNYSNNNLGRMLEEVGFGKAAIMAASHYGTAPKFSKYSGVVEWRNCVYIWVNIGGAAGDYNNSFSEKGRYITWFGGSRMHADTPVTQRLLQGGGQKETVLLWVRLEKEPYTCLGPVKAVHSDVEAHPVSIKWELLLFEQLSAKAKNTNLKHCNFAAVLEENDPPIKL